MANDPDRTYPNPAPQNQDKTAPHCCHRPPRPVVNFSLLAIESGGVQEGAGACSSCGLAGDCPPPAQQEEGLEDWLEPVVEPRNAGDHGRVIRCLARLPKRRDG